MWVAFGLSVGSVALVTCGFIWAARREEVAQVERIGRLTRLTFDEVAPGELCAVRGMVGGATILDPVTGERVVYYEARVLRSDRGEVLFERSEGESIELDDGSKTAATVELLGADIAVSFVEVERSDREPSRKMAELLGSIDLAVPDKESGARYSIEHRALRVGDELTLVGVPRRSGEGLRFTAADPLFLTPESLDELRARQRGDLRAMDAMLKLGAVFGVASIAVAIVLMLTLG